MDVEPRVVDQIDKELRGASIGAGHGITQESAQIAFDHRIIRNGLVSPGLGNVWFAGDAELGHKTGHHAKEA